ncbi:MAG: hypothetical protein ACRBDL_05715 [Alphaproteobacteria bacterium]
MKFTKILTIAALAMFSLGMVGGNAAYAGCGKGACVKEKCSKEVCAKKTEEKKCAKEKCEKSKCAKSVCSKSIGGDKKKCTKGTGATHPHNDPARYNS